MPRNLHLKQMGHNLIEFQVHDAPVITHNGDLAQSASLCSSSSPALQQWATLCTYECPTNGTLLAEDKQPVHVMTNTTSLVHRGGSFSVLLLLPPSSNGSRCVRTNVQQMERY